VEQSGAQDQAVGIVEQRASPPQTETRMGTGTPASRNSSNVTSATALGGLIQADVALAGLFLEA
jgi:hypothetical protein